MGARRRNRRFARARVGCFRRIDAKRLGANGRPEYRLGKVDEPASRWSLAECPFEVASGVRRAPADGAGHAEPEFIVC